MNEMQEKQETVESGVAILDTLLSAFDAVTNFVVTHPLSVALTLSLILSVVVVEVYKNALRVMAPEFVACRKKRRTSHLIGTVIIHWLIVGRLYDLVNGPFYWDVVVLSPVVSALLVWFLHRWIENKIIKNGADNMWGRIMVTLKPHRVVTDGKAACDFTPDETSSFKFDATKTILIKNGKKK